MKRFIKSMSMFAGVEDISSNGVVDPAYVPSESNMMDILNEIFSVDPISGLPKGDLAYYLSPDGNPDVKLWLENNLLKPRSIATGSSVEGVSDDLIAECARRSDESAFDYALRMENMKNEAIAEIEKLKGSNNE